MIRPPPRSKRTDTLFPYTTHFRSDRGLSILGEDQPCLSLNSISSWRLLGRREHHRSRSQRTGMPAATPLRAVQHRRRPTTITIDAGRQSRSEAHTSELQPPMRISYAVFCLKKKKE